MRIILLGLPGSGKEELARNLAKHYDIPVLTLESMLTEIAAEKTELGRLVKEAAFAGKFSDELIMAALRIRLARADAANGFVMEDFPRTTGQAETLDILMRGLRRPINAVLKIDIEADDLMEHLVGQITCQNCGEKYNIYTNPPIVEGMCNVCGEKIRRRPDDYEENIANRLRNCEMIMFPLIDLYRGKNMLHLVNGNNDKKKIYKLAVKILDGLPKPEIPEDDSDAPSLPMDESLIKALTAPKSDDDRPRRRGRPRRKPLPETVEASDTKAKAPVKAVETKDTDSEKADKKKAAKKVVKKSAKKKTETKKKSAAKKKAVTKKKVVGKKAAKKAVSKKKVAAKKKALAKKKAVKKKLAKKKVAKKVTARKKVVAKKKALARKKAASKKVVKKKVVKKAATKKAQSKKAQPKKTSAKKKTVKKKVSKKKAAAKKAVKKKTVKKKASRR